MAKHKVVQGECISSIGEKYGFFPDTIWNDPNNSELKRTRKTPYSLLPGDVVHVRDKEQRFESVATEKLHRFRRKGIPEFLNVVLVDDADEPLANMGYRIDIDGDVRANRKTGADGLLTEPIPPSAALAIVTLEDEDETVYEFDLGHLDPIETISGVQARLANLGFYEGAVDGALGPKTNEAVRKFRIACGLEEGEEIDDILLRKLEEAYER